MKNLNILIAFLFLVSPVWSERAPAGNYTAVTGGQFVTSKTKAGAVPAKGRAFIPEGVPISVTITSYSSKDELKGLAGVSVGQLGYKISNLNHGSISAGGRRYPINLATSYRVGKKHVIQLVTVKKASGKIEGIKAGTLQTGLITLVVPAAGGAGYGRLHHTTRALVGKDGKVALAKKRSIFTKLLKVRRN